MAKDPGKTAAPKTDLGRSSTGLSPNVAALLSYLGLIVTGIIFFVLEKESKFVKFHAMQAIVTFGGLLALQIALGILIFTAFLIPFVSLLGLILWIILMVKAYQGEMFKLPVVGELAEKQIK